MYSLYNVAAGLGKSLTYLSTPVVFDTVIAIVISPLTSHMQDQVRYLKSVGISAEFIGQDQTSEDANQLVDRGECQIVHGSPEAFLSTKSFKLGVELEKKQLVELMVVELVQVE